eukprot:100254-Rhodomonas_salina.2
MRACVPGRAYLFSDARLYLQICVWMSNGYACGWERNNGGTMGKLIAHRRGQVRIARTPYAYISVHTAKVGKSPSALSLHFPGGEWSKRRPKRWSKVKQRPLVNGHRSTVKGQR